MSHVVEYPEQRAARIVGSIISIILMIIVSIIFFIIGKNNIDNSTNIQMYKIVSIEEIGLIEGQQYHGVIQIHALNPQGGDTILVADNLYRTGNISADRDIEKKTKDLTIGEFYVFEIHLDTSQKGYIISIQQTP